MEAKTKKYFTKAQQTAMLISANTEVILGSRRSGKSHARVGPTALRNAQYMPRSCGGFVSSTFKQAHKRTVPAMLVGLQDLGYKRDVHYVLGRKPDKKLGFPRPYVEPDDWHDVLSWYNGSIMTILSQDVSMSANSMTLDYIIGDEARGLDFQKLKEDVFPANGGTQRYFSDCPWHHSILFTSDMPIGKQGSWLFDYKDKMDPEVIDIILALQAEKYQLLSDKMTQWGERKLKEIDAMSSFRRWPSIMPNGLYSRISTCRHRLFKMMKRDFLLHLSDIYPVKKLSTSRASILTSHLAYIHTLLTTIGLLTSTDGRQQVRIMDVCWIQM